MIEIKVDNSYSKITGLTKTLEKELMDELSYLVGGSSSYFSRFGPKRHSLLSKKGDFPSGLLTRVCNFVQTKAPFIKVSMTPGARRNQFAVKYTGFDLHLAQSDALRACEIKCRGTVVMPTGTGKSIVICALIARFGLRTLVVVPNIELKKQLMLTIRQTLGEFGSKYVSVENIDSKFLKTANNYDCLIIDEAHHSAAKTYQNLNKGPWSSISHRFFFSATPYRNDPEEQLLFEGIAGDIIYELSYEQAVKDRYIVPVAAFYMDVSKMNTDAYTYAQVYSALVVNNNERNIKIASLLVQLDLSQQSTICLVKEVEHGKRLAKLTGFKFVSGQDEESRQYIQQFNKGLIKVLIGTTGVIGEGVDTKPCEWVVIASPGKARSQFQQQIGRAVRIYPGKESAKVIIFRDASHKFLLKHFNAQRKILLDFYGIKPVKLTI